MSNSLPTRSDVLIQELRSSSVEGALERAMAELSHHGECSLLLETAAALARVEAAGIGVRLLRAAGSEVNALPAVEDVRSKLEALPSGGTPLAQRRSVFEGNCLAAVECQPNLRSLLNPDDPSDPEVLLFETTKGNRHLIRENGSSRLGFLLPFADHETQADAIVAKLAVDGMANLFIGVPSISLMSRLLDRRAPNGYRPPIDIIESDSSMLRIWLHLLPIDEAIARGQVHLFVGERAPEDYEQFRGARHCRDARFYLLRCARPNWRSPPIDGSWPRRIESLVAERRDALNRRQREFYDDESDAARAERFVRAAKRRAPLRIVGFTTRFSTVIRHAMRDLAGAFERRGCEFTLVTEPDESSTEVDTWSTLARQPFDLVIVINHLRHELGSRIHPNLPFVCWMQDRMDRAWTREAGRTVSDRDLIISGAPWFMEMMYDYPRDCMIESSNLTDVSTYSNEPIAEQDRARFASDVMFVSHGSQTPESIVGALRSQNDRLGRLMAMMLATMHERLDRGETITSMRIFELLLEMDRSLGTGAYSADQIGLQVQPIALSLYDRVLRHQALEWAAAWARDRGRTLRIYGREWSGHPTLKAFAAGEIANGADLRCAYQAASICLHVNGYGSLHQRLLDCLASGGFALTRFNPTDFRRQPLLRLAQLINTNEIGSLETLHRMAREDDTLRQLLGELTTLGVPCLDVEKPQAIEHELATMRDAGMLPPELATEVSYFEAIRDLRYVPHRLAGDLPGFAETTFASRAELHDLLDRFADDPGERDRIACPMRESVLEHDTVNSLVGRMLAHFATRFARMAEQPEADAANEMLSGVRS